MNKLVNILNTSFHFKLIYTIVFTIYIGVYTDVSKRQSTYIL